MMKKVLLILCLAVLLVSCTQNQGSPTKTAARTTSGDSSTPPQVIESVQQSSPEVQDLLEKSIGLTNYKYLFDASETDSYELWRKDGLLKKVYSDPVKLGKEDFYNEVYLDMDTKTAIGICTEAGVLCGPVWKVSFTLNYDYELPSPDPVELVEAIGYAERTGTERVESRSTTIVNLPEEKQRFWLDDYYGFPLKYVRYELRGDVEQVLEKHTFSKVQVNQVKTSDVTMPTGYTTK